MSLLETPTNPTLDPFDVAAGIDVYETPLDRYLKAKMGEGWWSTIPGQIGAQMMSSPGILPGDTVNLGMPGDAEEAAASAAAAPRPGEAGSPVMAEAEWKASPYARKGLEWDERMTPARAQALADIHDDNTYRRWLIEQSPNGLRSVPGFLSQMVGGAPDPVNYLPIFGPAGRAAALARFGGVLGPNAAKILAPAAVQGAEAMIGTAAAEPFLQSSLRSFGDDVGFADAVLDVAFAGAFGAGLGAAHGGWRAWRERGAVLDVRAQEAAAAQLEESAAALARGDLPSLRPDSVTASTERLRAAIREVDADPVGDPYRPLVELDTGEMKKLIVARGGFRDINALEINRQGWGLVKVIWKHGWKSDEPAHLQVSEADVLALPEVVAAKAPIEDGRPDVFRTWIVERDSPFGRRKILYGAKIMDGAAHDTLVTVHVVTPGGDKDRLPLSADKGASGNERAGVRVASRGEVSRSAADTAATGSQSMERGRAGTPAHATIADRAYTVTGREVDVSYEVVEASDLVTSHTDDLTIDPRFPAPLQPRDRGRAASADQINRMAAALRPELLGRSPSVGSGAPIVGPPEAGHGGVVESGNGRVLAIRRAYAAGDGGRRYRDWLEAQGFATAGMREPVLIRRRRGDMTMEQRAAFAREANDQQILALSAAERARADAYGIDAEMVSLYRGGAFTSMDNRDFVRAFLDRVSPEDRGGLLDAQGRLSAEGVRRLESALLSKAYDDPNLIAVLTEHPDHDIKTIGAVLKAVSPDWIALRAAVAEGNVARDMDQTPALLRAVDLIRQARSRGEKVRDIADQLDLFDPIGREVTGFLKLFYGDDLSRAVGRDRLSAALGRFVSDAMVNWAPGRALIQPRSVMDVLDAARGVRTKEMDFSRPAERPRDDAAPARPHADGEAEAIARDHAVDPHTGEFDELLDYRQLEDSGRLHPDETNAVRRAEAEMARAETYSGGFEAAAICTGRAA